MHFATDIAREHYLAFSLAEDYSFRMDKYLGIHPDIFDTPGYGAHINNSPGVSMFGAIPYWIARPIIDPVVARINASRAASGAPVTAIYDDPRRGRVDFFRKARERGWDIKFGLAAGVMQLLFTAPVSAFAAVVMFWLLQAAGLTNRQALLGALVYAFGTPIFFRSAFLNQNLFSAHLLLFGFAALWRPGPWPAWRDERAWTFAGLMGGTALLSDYSGTIIVAALGLYAVWIAWSASGTRRAVQSVVWYTAGALGPLLLLLFYQWRSFGSPWYPGQHYMPPVDFSDLGYQGFAPPDWQLFKMLLLSPQYGLLIGCPLMALSAIGLVQSLRGGAWLPRREAVFLSLFSFAFVVFFSAVQYTHLQYLTGIRYLVPVVPALFLLAFVCLLRMPTPLRALIVILTIAESWCLSMVRARDISDSIAQAMLGGLQLPWVTVLSRMAPQYLPWLEERASPLVLMLVCAAIIYAIWRYPEPEPL